jgi:hypothetical protein
MSESHLRTAGPSYAKPVFLLSLAFICPALLFISRPVSYVSLLLATAVTAICLALAWVAWKTSSDVSTYLNPIPGTDAKPGKARTHINPRILNIPIVFTLLSSPLLFAGDLSHYRNFQFGMNLSHVANLVDLEPSQATLIHQRPARIQELAWHPFIYRTSDDADPVNEGVFSFYNDQLFRMVINYDRYKVEGMTVADMIQSISAVYGVAETPNVEIPFHSDYAESAPVLARWENPEYSCNLIRTGNQYSFVLVLVSKRLDALAQPAIAEAGRLDAQEAPQKAIDLQKQHDETVRLAMEQTRATNKPKFRP